MRNYEQVIKHLNEIAIFRKDRVTLNNMKQMTQLLGNPQNYMQFIHIAGTNGKGSLTLKINKLFQQLGKCGSFTSPHIYCFRERIQINDEMISKEYVEIKLNELFSIANKANIQLTYFEYVTCLALSYFKDFNVQYVSWETGLGGRMDSTNIIQKSLLSIITTIGYDHMHILGNTLQQIAYEKAGIIKQNCPVVIGPKCQPLSIFINEAKSKQAPLYQLQQQFMDFRQENNAIFLKSQDVLTNTYGFQFKDINICLNAEQPCRMELNIVKNNKGIQIKIYIDVGHNEQAITQVLNQLNQQNIICIYGTSNDKDYNQCLNILKKYSQQLYLVQANNKRALNISQISRSDIIIFQNGDIVNTVTKVINDIESSDQIILIIGSFYIIQDVKSAIKSIQNNCDSNE